MIQLTEEQKSKLDKYMEGILSWNEKVNLTNITDPDEFRVKHTLDSLVCLDFPEYVEAKSVIDVGTGGGFPGIPLAVCSPEKEFLLLDSLNKRLKIIGSLTEELGIKNVSLLHSRAEDACGRKEYRENFDACVSRAVSNLSTLSEYCLPFIRREGYLLAYKGPECERELKDAFRALKILGGEAVDIRDTEMKEYGLEHKILVIRKVKNTPKAYPRKAGTPLRNPL